MLTTLNLLQPGDRAEICAFLIGASPLRRRLLALGLLPGTNLEVLRRAPLGDPMQVRVRHTSLALRRDEAAALSVRRLEPV